MHFWGSYSAGLAHFRFGANPAGVHPKRIAWLHVLHLGAEWYKNLRKCVEVWVTSSAEAAQTRQNVGNHPCYDVARVCLPAAKVSKERCQAYLAEPKSSLASDRSQLLCSRARTSANILRTLSMFVCFASSWSLKVFRNCSSMNGSRVVFFPFL